MQRSQIQEQIWEVNSNTRFSELALELFRMQSEQNKVYQDYLNALKIELKTVNSLKNIPFLPIEFFKTREVKTGEFVEEVVFTSSGTTGMSTSRHFVRSADWYERVFMKAFSLAYGPVSNYSLLALLPSYLERSGSSLIVMAQKLIEESKDFSSGFYLRDYERLKEQLSENERLGKKTILLGVTFALLDFAERYPMSLKNTVIMETGGMKGMREELTRDEMGAILRKAFSVKSIHSEYGMTELMSQAYAQADGIFRTPPWMKVLVRDPNDPLSVSETGRGVLNIIDLANVDSCAFIATQDLGEVFADGSFSVLGRMDRSDLRGCNLLVL